MEVTFLLIPAHVPGVHITLGLENITQLSLGSEIQRWLNLLHFCVESDANDRQIEFVIHAMCGLYGDK